VTPRSPYITVAEAANRIGYSERTIRELCRTNRIPHRKLAGGSSPCLFVPRELDAWVDGAPLIVEPAPAHGGRVVRVDAKERAA
jgi:excisionase family DNA binding protein